MKKVYVAYILFHCLLIATCQNQIEGLYYNYFGDKLELYTDSTFSHKWANDLSSSWSVGTWILIHDTLFLKISPKYDTIRKTDGSYNLVLASEISYEQDSTGQFNTEVIFFGQNYHPPSEKYLFRRSRLYYLLPDGKPIKRKQPRAAGNRKYKSYYIKDE